MSERNDQTAEKAGPSVDGPCDTCEHAAGRHGEDGCKPERPGDQPCGCPVMRWQGHDWPRPWLPAPDGRSFGWMTTTNPTTRLENTMTDNLCTVEDCAHCAPTVPAKPADDLCVNCDQPIRQINFASRKQWLHVNPSALFVNQREGTAWLHCKQTVATPGTAPDPQP